MPWLPEGEELLVKLKRVRGLRWADVPRLFSALSKKSWGSLAHDPVLKEVPEQSGFLSKGIFIYCTDKPPFSPIRRPRLRKPRVGKQVLRRGPVLGPPAQHSRNKVYKLGHSVVTINFLSHKDQVFFSDELGEFELSYQIS
jgi:hypothetical protein